MADKAPTQQSLEVLYGRDIARELIAARAAARIKSAVASSREPALDLEVALSRDIRAAIEALAEKAVQPIFLDVPLTAVVALGHKNFAPEARTWRVLLQGVHGVGWRDESIGWMESEIGLRWFPAEWAAEPLKMTGVGGALLCANGMHRLVGTVCWLATSQGSGAQLRKVAVCLRPLYPRVRRLLAGAHRRGARVDVALVDDTRAYLRVVLSKAVLLHVCEDGRVARVVLARTLWRRIRRGQWQRKDSMKLAGLSWQTLPPRIVAALADEAWVRTQFVAPKYEPYEG
ncbi:hypothetical protein [Paraburkholderia kururiensis]|uniref:hypothetical protein n=1 Tax=Paraburkholderia kururiensis TaxID=984307 RepID=UPI000F89C25D|nr:hypothetical protein [Paraburkholderia kururiensis]